MHVMVKISIAICAVIAVLALDIVCTSGHIFFYRPDRKKTATMSIVKQIATALMLYAVDNDDRLPHKFSTHQDLSNSVSRFFSSAYQLPEGEIPETFNPNGGTIIPNRLLEGMLQTGKMIENDILQASKLKAIMGKWLEKQKKKDL